MAGEEHLGVRVEVLGSVGTIAAEWRDLAARAGAAVYQQPGWTEAWIETVGRIQHQHPVIVVIRSAGRIAAILPLVVERSGPLRIARFPGGEHANIRMPIADPERLSDLADPQALAGQIVTALRGLAVRVDIVDLDALPLEWNGRAVPLSSHPAARPARLPVASLALVPDLGIALGAKRRARKAKKHRSQVNALAPVGGYRFHRAGNREEAARLFDRFRSDKSAWFAKMGIADSFAEPGMPEFFGALIERRWRMGESLLDLYAIEIDGAVRAIFGGGTASGRMSGYFLSIADDEWRRITPGELILHDVIASCCAEGLRSIDLGRGDDRYKASWLDSDEPQVRLLLPVTMLGRLGLAALRFADASERRLRENPALWRFAKKTRQWLGGRRQAEAEAPD